MPWQPKQRRLNKPSKRIKPGNWISVDPRAPGPAEISRAAMVMARGGVVVFPTRGLYGLGADAFDDNAVSRVFQIKRRALSKPLPVLIARRKDLETLVARIPPAAEKLIARFWPGRVTLVFPGLPHVNRTVTAKSGKIAVRQVAHPVAADLISALGQPITGTSANVSSNPGCARIDFLDAEIAGAADLIIDAGVLKGGAGSTVVDTTRDPLRILREGAVGAKDIWDSL